ncbi:hypothetical protein C8R31_10290 [Nitrosospira sp. Nsp2]|nr:hypothetical protein C8R31_10290 [Nitrosospira sp. Nsp2]
MQVAAAWFTAQGDRPRVTPHSPLTAGRDSARQLKWMGRTRLDAWDYPGLMTVLRSFPGLRRQTWHNEIPPGATQVVYQWLIRSVDTPRGNQ